MAAAGTSSPLHQTTNRGEDEPDAHQQRRDRQPQDEPSTGLGIDEEIKIRKPRKPTAKLDEERLLSQKGIPKLRRITKDRLKFKGKGHEFSDVAKLMTLYQLWLDDLFPKARFADGLAMIEKLGHSKHMRVMRKGWIDDEKPKQQAEAIDDFEDGDFAVQDGNDEEDGNALWGGDGGNGVEDVEARAWRDDTEELYGAPVETGGTLGNDMDDVPDEDELNVLFEGENDKRTDDSRQPPPPVPAPPDETYDFADEEEVLAGMW